MSLLPGGTTYNLTLADSVTYPFDVEFVNGPWYLGMMLGTLLQGVCWSQSATFYLAVRAGAHSTFDRWIVLLLNAFLTTLFAASTRFGFWLYVIDAGIPTSMLSPHDDSLYAIQILNAFTSATGAAFYAWRAYKLWGSKLWLGLLMSAGILFGLVSGMLLTINTVRFQKESFLSLEERRPQSPAALTSHSWFPRSASTSSLVRAAPPIRSLILPAYISSAVLDIGICALIVAKLMGKRQGFSQWTDNLLVRLATVVFGSSALTCGGAIVLAVLCLLPTGNVAALWLPLVYNLIPRMYGVSVLFVLNNRDLIAGRPGASSTGKHQFASQAVSGIRVELETVHRSDGPSEFNGDYDPTRSEKHRMAD